MKKTLFLLCMAAGLCIIANAQAQSGNSRYVDPLIGSGGHGHVFVGANMPFGAVQLGPMNVYQGWDWCSGYNYNDPVVIGFSHTHLSGTGCADLGDVCLMPFIGNGRPLKNAPTSTYSHHNEQASAGYYKVTLDNGVTAELTATERVGLHRYTFPTASTIPCLLLDLVSGTGNKAYEAYVRLVDDHTVEGYRFTRGWAPFRKVFFYAKFNKPILRFSTLTDNTQVDEDELQGRQVKSVATFPTDTREVMAKVALSSVSITSARRNMEAEAGDWDFDKARERAAGAWDKALGVIDIDATDRQKTVFYTALYHTMTAPTLYCDVDGRFRGMDDKIHGQKGQDNYTVFSLWDTYRALHPLFTVIMPQRVDPMINSMLSIYEQNGKLPIWPLQSGETNCMPGYSSVPVIADAYLKGFRGFDPEKALQYMISTATNPRQNGVSEFMKYGYIPADLKGEATSINLEYAADDWGTALMAKALGHNDIYRAFLKRGQSYQLLFDKSIQKIRPKMQDGSWYAPYDPFLANHRNHVGDFTEGNGWQYTFMVPQDPDGLIAAHGGDEAFIKNLDSLFVVDGDLGEGAPPDVTGRIGMYAHGNEPCHHIPYLYAYAGEQWKSAQMVRRIQRDFYHAAPDGYCGNEDCGQMSAWHILSALGFYQVNPSNGVFVLGSPLFKKAVIHLEGGKDFTILAPKNSDSNIYIRSARLNGKAYSKACLNYKDIMGGGTLQLDMDSKPNKKFGLRPADRPVSAR